MHVHGGIHFILLTKLLNILFTDGLKIDGQGERGCSKLMPNISGKIAIYRDFMQLYYYILLMDI